jgi:hypothetical protein
MATLGVETGRNGIVVDAVGARPRRSGFVIVATWW